MGKIRTLREAAERINCPEETLRYWVKEGTAPASFRMGRRRMFDEDAIEAWLDEQKAKSA